ncbi:hypothetical protein [Aneurinibacillus sp. UBA3580]|jgi:hypothetical protein|uniref:hypothetical protein n=1 Tax=Aneurinibacillus sp. UBA3580 TaxID=1946041 RepID=UPI00257D5BB4|nr:hypothetical protein [Aneurinibacillus sp. UBA3580]
MIYGFMTGRIFQQLNRMQPSLVELIPGQVFQGKVLKLFPDNLATVQVGGLTVTARLETPLELGQRTWLQVQPGGQPVTLKVISQPGKPEQASEASMEGLAKGLGVPVTRESISLLKKAVDTGIPLRADSLRSFRQLAAEFGEDPAMEEAVLLAAKKGLPLTKDTVLALRAFIKNANLDGEMGKLFRLVEQTLTDAESLPSDMKETLQRLFIQTEGAREAVVQVKNAIVSLQQTANPAGQQNGKVDPKNSRSALQSLQGEQDQVAGNESLSSPSSQGMKQAITDLFERLGLTHERTLARMTGEKAAEVENIKSTLLYLLQHPKADALPATVREQMQQFVHQVTGQQLMMGAGSENNAFVQVAIQLPLPGQEDGENALIHIESRKKGKGEIDPDNCRLFFYLSMQNIGETMLDVSIVNKIVSLHLYNNREGLEALVRALRASLEQNLAKEGYRLSGLRVSEMPEERQQEDSKPTPPLPLPNSSLVHYKGVDFRV